MKKLNSQNNLAKRELDILKFWQKHGIFQQSLKQRQGQEEFVFYEGPPTANAKPGLHHMLARAFKDVVLRYKTMRGYLVKRRAGWDTHGLPVEVQVEKQLGLKNKGEIENIVPGDSQASITEFNKKCKESVWQNKQEWESFTERMGYWLDFDNAYITYESVYIEQLWAIIKKVYDRGLLIKRHKVVPYCPRCGTPLSSHEVAQEYEDVSDRTVYVKFKVEGEENTYLLAWTTTPWTLPGNVALAVNLQVEYSKVNLNGEYLWLAKGLIPQVIGGDLKNLPVLDTVKGDKLVGIKYEPLFKVKPLLKAKKVYQVIAASFVTTEEGTGIVHTAAMYGVDDYEEAVKQDLPRIHTVDEGGHFKDLVPEFAGQEVGEAADDIIKYLKEHNSLLREQEVTHSYPFCWRCKSRLLYYAKDSWFIEITKLKDHLIKMNSKVTWIPEHLKNGRYGEWLAELRDWAFSRERYWGTPLPVWTNKETGNHLVVGSIKELRERAVNPNQVGGGFDPHRPFVDQVKLKDETGQIYEFEGVICDAWFDSGAMPFASGEDKTKRYPADFIVEAVDQTRGWFYTLQAVAALMDKTESPYATVISLGHVNDEQGKKMSKSLGNIIDPLVMGEKYGMDAIRFYLYTINQPGQTKRFSESDLVTSYRQNQLLLNNVANYLLTYRPLDFQYKFDPIKTPQKLLDRWIVAKTAKLISDPFGGVGELMEHFDITNAARKTSEYLNDLSQGYLRNCRGRQDDEFFQTLTYALCEFTKIIAPFTPFIAEDIWRQVRGDKDQESVHLTDWPELKITNQMKNALREVKGVEDIVSFTYVLRQQEKIKLRQTLSELQIKVLKEGVELSEEALEVIKKSVNVLEVKVVDGIKKSNKVRVVLITSRYEIALNVKLTDGLKKMGDERELRRALQAARKQAGLEPGQKAQVRYSKQSQFSLDELTLIFKELSLTGEERESDDVGKEVKLSNGEEFIFEVSA